ncbi:hypothetical protein DFH06DRAFT_691830 [Mycena polygramma]|nr:hypothetical protein DFH06DRAFT_691830 [Mycena polygramma]
MTIPPSFSRFIFITIIFASVYHNALYPKLCSYASTMLLLCYCHCCVYPDPPPCYFLCCPRFVRMLLVPHCTTNICSRHLLNLLSVVEEAIDLPRHSKPHSRILFLLPRGRASPSRPGGEGGSARDRERKDDHIPAALASSRCSLYLSRSCWS